ncbi:MAG: hypothetical protein WBD40_00170 [Tepidisphaeraceae bacterium]
MTLNLSISEQAEAGLKARAAAAGMAPEAYAARLLERHIAKMTIDELLAPVRAEFEASGMTEDELVELLEAAKHEMRAEQRGRKAS